MSEINDDYLSKTRFVVIHKALSWLYGEKRTVELADKVRYHLLVSYGINPLHNANGLIDAEGKKRELMYAEECLNGAGMDVDGPVRTIERLGKGEPAGLEALIDIEYGISWDMVDEERGPPWMMGDWRMMAKLVKFVSQMGLDEGDDQSLESFRPGKALRLWPVEEWESVRGLELGNGIKGYATKAMIGINNKEKCVFCEESPLAHLPYPTDKIPHGDGCVLVGKFDEHGSGVELETRERNFQGREWVAFPEGPLSLMDRTSKTGKKLTRLQWKSLASGPAPFGQFSSGDREAPAIVFGYFGECGNCEDEVPMVEEDGHICCSNCGMIIGNTGSN